MRSRGRSVETERICPKARSWAAPPDEGRGDHHPDCQLLGQRAVAILDKIGQGQIVSFSKLPGQEKAHQEQAEAEAERVSPAAGEAVFIHRPRRAQAGFSSEPGGKEREGNQKEGNSAAADEIVSFVLYFPGKIQTDEDLNDDIKDN